MRVVFIIFSFFFLGGLVTQAQESETFSKTKKQQELESLLFFLKHEFVASSTSFNLKGYIDARENGKYAFDFIRNKNGFELIPQPLDTRFGPLKVELDSSSMLTAYHYKNEKKWRIIGSEYMYRIKDSVVSYHDLSFDCFNWNIGSWLNDEEVSNRNARVVQLSPAKVQKVFSNYTKAKIYIDEKTQALVKIEYFDQTNFLLKRLVIIDVFKQDGYWFPQKIRVEAFDKRSLVLAKVNYIVFEQAQKALPPAFKD